MLDSLEKLIELLTKQTPSQMVLVLAMAVIVGAVYFLYTEYKKASQKVSDLYKEKEELHKEKLEMAQEMLKMANEYNEQMIHLQRETSSTITSLMAMFNIMSDR